MATSAEVFYVFLKTNFFAVIFQEFLSFRVSFYWQYTEFENRQLLTDFLT